MRLPEDRWPTAPWGKLHPRGAPTEWHPLNDHCIDVAAVAEALLTLPTWQRRLAALAGRPQLDPVTVQRLVFVAGLHDLGKINQGFQAKARADGSPTAGHVDEGAIFVLPAGDALSRRLADAAGLTERAARWGSGLLPLLHAALSHHGAPIGAAPASGASLWRDLPQHRPAASIAALAAALAAGLPRLDEAEAPALPDDLREGAPFVHAFAGLVMLADWIGSNRAVFPFREEADGDRWPLARAAAAEALRTMGIAVAEGLRWPERPPLARALTGHSALRPAQAAVAALPLPAPEGPGSTLLLEAATGSGKTEAAFLHFLRLFDADRVDGLVFALPTRAAATQLHGRLVKLVGAALAAAPPAVVLGVPGYLRFDQEVGVRLEGFEVLWPDGPGARPALATWAVEQSKRYLAAPVLVCTVDQVLAGALATKHAHLRATTGLRQLLVIDEVHASDHYMRMLLGEVLQRHRSAGGHALLMSATLGVSARAELLAAPVRTRRRPAPPTLAEALAEPYPRVALHQGAEAAVAEVPEGDHQPKAVTVRCEPWAAEPTAAAAVALEAARQGLRVLIIRNTVTDCLLTQRAVEAEAGSDTALLFSLNGRPCPHHSRYAPIDRSRLDVELERRMGQRRGLVVVATQTVQQSLDIDADLLLTDLCPMDVLLQRIGRLHRHNDPARPPAGRSALALLMTPAVPDLRVYLSRSDGAPSGGRHGIGAVYDDLRGLAATWAIASSRPRWALPDDNRSLVEQATHPEALAAHIGADPAWARHAAWVAGGAAAKNGAAKLVTVPWTQPFSGTRFPSQEERIATRLGLMDRSVPLPAGTPSPFGGSLTELRLPAWMAPPEAELPRPALCIDAEGFGLTLGARRYRYDRLGLTLEGAASTGTATGSGAQPASPTTTSHTAP